MKRQIKEIITRIRRLLKIRVNPVFWTDIKLMPVFNWIEMQESGGLKHLLIKGEPTHAEIKKAYHKVNNQYLRKYGLTDNLKQVMKTRKRLAIALADYLITGDRMYQMDADILMKEIEKENEITTSMTYSDITAIIESEIGIIDLHTMSVDKYYAHLDRLKKLNTKKNG